MVEPGNDLDRVPEGEHTYTRYPWMVSELKKMDLKRKLRNLVILALIVGSVYLMFRIFSWYYLLALITGPAWFFWAMRHIDRECYILIECRLKGDQYQEGRYSNDTQTNIYQIPPDLWHEAQMFGSPFTPGSRIYICDRFEEDPETGELRIYFGDTPELSNMHFYTRLALWLELKRQLPKAMHDIAIYRYNIDIISQERVVSILEQMGILKQYIEDPSSRRIVVRRVKMEVNDLGREQEYGDDPGNER